MNYVEALTYLESLGTFGIQLGLTRIEALLGKLDHPERRFRSVHVTGTNGKGSTSACIASILKEAGIRTGLYTSPHLEDYPERIRIDDKDISREELAEVLEDTRQAAERMKAEGSESPTEFEVLTAAAFLWFARKEAEFVVVEVGLGGLLDSTNVIIPEVSVITNVTLEHADKCGGTLEGIAEHKAGIIKQGKPVITGATGVALSIIERTASDKETQCLVLNRDFWSSPGVYTKTKRRQSFVFHEQKGHASLNCDIGLLGRHQVDNASLAVAACRVLAGSEPRLTDVAIQHGLAKTVWPGRFEVLSGEPEIVLDGAHNPDGIRTLRQTLDEVFPKRSVVFLFGVLADKSHKEMIRTLFRPKDRVVVVRPNSQRAADPALIAGEIAGNVKAVETAISIECGLERARELARPEGLVCAAGSLYMIGEVRHLVRADEVATRQNHSEFI